MALTNDEIKNRLGYHKATFPKGFNPAHDQLATWSDVSAEDGTRATAPIHAAVRKLFIDTAIALRDLVPVEQGRYLALAMTSLEEAMHWSNAAVAMTSPLIEE